MADEMHSRPIEVLPVREGWADSSLGCDNDKGTKVLSYSKAVSGKEKLKTELLEWDLSPKYMKPKGLKPKRGSNQ